MKRALLWLLYALALLVGCVDLIVYGAGYGPRR
jgi:hypothetical protein